MLQKYHIYQFYQNISLFKHLTDTFSDKKTMFIIDN